MKHDTLPKGLVMLPEGPVQMHDKIELQLIEAVKRGDSRAFDVLVLRYQSRVFKIVARYIHDHSEILDVSQEVFIKAYRALAKFRGESSFYTWLYRIAVNTAKNYLVSQGRRLPDIDLEVTERERFVARNVPKENASPEHLYIRDEMEDKVLDTIDHLPEDLKTAIMLCELEGLSYEDIARMMACPVGTVRSRIFRARAVIHRNIQSYLQP